MADLHRAIKVGILTVSDTCYNGKAEDKSGENLKGLVESGKWFKGTVTTKDIIHDVAEDIKAKLLHWSDSLKLDVVLTTGGTGFSPRDVTPEATKAIIDKEALGMAVAMIKGSLDITPLAMLSRLVCGIRGTTLIINLPGSTKGSAECLQIVAGSIPHAVDLLHSDKSNVETTHSSLQSEGIKSVSSGHSPHSSDADADILSCGGCKNVKSKLSSSPNLLKHLKCDEKQQSSLMRDCLTQFNEKIKDFLEQIIKGTALSNFNFIECHIANGLSEPNHWMNIMTKFMQVLVFVIEDFTRTLGVSQQLNSVSLSSQISKAVESKMKSLIQSCQEQQHDQTFLSPPAMPGDTKFSHCGLGRNDDTDLIKSFISEEENRKSSNQFLHQRSSAYPSCQIESHVCKSSSYLSNAKRLKKHTSSSLETNLYCKRNENVSVALTSSSYSMPNSYKMFHQNSVNCSKGSDSPRIVTYPGQSSIPKSVLTKKAKTIHEYSTKPVQIDLLIESKQTPENFLFREGEYFHPSNCNWESRKEENMPRIPYPINSKEVCAVVSSSSHDSNGLKLCVKQAADEISLPNNNKFPLNSPCGREKNNYLKEKANEYWSIGSDGVDNHSQSPDIAMKKYNSSPNSTLASNSSGLMLSSPSKSVVETSQATITAVAKSQASVDSKPYLPCNIMSAKIHNVNNQGELVNVPVGKAFNCFVNDHRLLKGISLYKGKRDIKKLLVFMSRQEDVTGQATSWKRGKEVLERNRFDDYFQLTREGMEEQQQVLCGRKRDQYVVNWYMWCPGHGNCKRKCGGFGKCIENCKGMLHKQDRHNCSLMVNLKLFLSDLSTWRVHITGSHLPEQTENVPTATASSSPQGERQCPHDSRVQEKSGSFLSYAFNNSDQSIDKIQSSSSDTPVTLIEASVEMNPYLSNVSNNEFGNGANVISENERNFEQSKIPSKKRISKMLSNLKRRRQNKPYGLIKSRSINSNTSCENGNGASKMSFPKTYSQDFEHRQQVSSSIANPAYPVITSNTALAATAPYNQGSLLNELSSYLPGGSTNEMNHEVEGNLTVESLCRIVGAKSISSVTKPALDNAPISYTCPTTTAPKYTDSLTDYIATHNDLPVNLETTGLPQEDVDIYHSAMSLPNFHQPFLHANSLTEILTEAGVNISEQFDDLNSSISLGNDSTNLSGMDSNAGSINESFLHFQPSHQVFTQSSSSSSLLTNESPSAMLPHCQLTDLQINTTRHKSAQSSFTKGRNGLLDTIEDSY